MTQEQFAHRIMADYLALHSTGVTELTGKRRDRRSSQARMMDAAGVEGGGEGRFGGLSKMFPMFAGERPKALAAALKRGKGKIYRRALKAAMGQAERLGYRRSPKSRTRRAARPGVAPHQGLSYCKRCKVEHTKSQHRFHGPGSFDRTHLFAFGPRSNPPAKKIYGQLLLIVAKKTAAHRCDAKCSAAGHIYKHPFTSKPSIYGLPDGSLLIR